MPWKAADVHFFLGAADAAFALIQALQANPVPQAAGPPTTGPSAMRPGTYRILVV
ncbi:hypothetical protein [Streptomyces halobius]|uniref:Uncharacterized protein n=1 Tax=Streptomyces halobius TaxID=2879846 RepID=A0ABY4MP19_9ACTN|nr:hypothetical protein [Streptomyces halobius]UQA98200.1 hypothetical protein K9S39_28110 [Streptomyces halobius]